MTDTLNQVDLNAVGALTECCIQQPGKAKTTWAARVEWTGGFTSKAYIRDFQPITSDEPPALGGKNTSPNPVEQFLAALGNCLSVGYAAALTSKGITIKKLQIHVDGDLNLQTFLGINKGNAGFETIRVNVELEADAEQSVLQSIHEAVTGTSPVGHSIQRPVPIVYSLNGKQ